MRATRRDFLAASAATAAGLTLGVPGAGRAAPRRKTGPNDRIRMGFIGIGNRGTQLLHRFMANDDVEVAALCDVYDPYLARDPGQVDAEVRTQIGGRVPGMGESFPGEVARYKDFRRLLEQSDIDAVCIATPDHLHAVQMIMAVEAGKDVYVEKPLTVTIHEGRKMVEAVARTGRVVQVGLNRRGSLVYQRLAERMRAGIVGPVSLARAYRISNMYPDGIGRARPSEPPAGLDWDLWLGPRPMRPYQANIAPYKFRWWKSYSSQMGNWGVHYLDVIRWMLGERAPVAVTAHGSHRVVDDDRTIPDTMEVTFEFASGALAIFGIYEACGGRAVEGGEIEFRGAMGNVLSDQNGFSVVPTGSGQFQDWETLVEAEEYAPDDQPDSTSALIRNFLDCVTSREEPLCPIEEGHRSTSFAHLANISLELGARIEWDAEAERVTNLEAANDLLHYAYRSPWTLG